MKKIFLASASAAALFAAPALAQQTQESDIWQNGEDNSATVTQTGVEGLSDIDQDGDDNVAEVTQSETSGSTPFNTAANVSNIDQDGDNSRARVEQTNDNPGGASNIARI